MSETQRLAYGDARSIVDTVLSGTDTPDVVNEAVDVLSKAYNNAGPDTMAYTPAVLEEYATWYAENHDALQEQSPKTPEERPDDVPEDAPYMDISADLGHRTAPPEDRDYFSDWDEEQTTLNYLKVSAKLHHL